MNQNLKEMVKRGEVGFDDVFEAYAMLCISQVRDITEDMILDEGVNSLVSQGTDLSTQGLIDHATDWALVHVPEMTGDCIDTEYVKQDDESWLQFVIRVAVLKVAKDNKSFQIKLS